MRRRGGPDLAGGRCQGGRSQCPRRADHGGVLVDAVAGAVDGAGSGGLGQRRHLDVFLDGRRRLSAGAGVGRRRGRRLALGLPGPGTEPAPERAAVRRRGGLPQPQRRAPGHVGVDAASSVSGAESPVESQMSAPPPIQFSSFDSAI